MQKSKTVVVIAGPTAVGKTAVAIAVAKAVGTEIISADSRQCYAELSIGVARPSADELAAVPHHFIASHSIHQKVTAATFEAYALAKATELFAVHDVVVMAGGTGLYVKSFCEGLDSVPEVLENLRRYIVAGYQSNGLEWLQYQVRQSDPQFATKGEMQNPHRLMRALEVVKATGNSILSYQKQQPVQRPFNIIKIGLELPREDLYSRINGRVDAMVAAGLKAEVEALLLHQHMNALQTVGYKEWFAHFADGLTEAQAIEEIKTHTRQYAKRQMTWFKRDADMHWLPPDAEAVIEYINGRLG